MAQATDTVWLPVLPSMKGFGPAIVKGGSASAAASGKTLGRTVGRGMVLGMAAAGAAVAGFGAYGLNEFAKFEKGMKEVFTLLPGISNEAMGKMNDDTRKFVREMGIAHDEAVPALYSAISAGIPKENVFDFMEVAARASIGGVTDMNTAVDGLTSVMNAYGRENMSATEASDLMFTAVKLGKTDFEELSGSLFNVLPTASALGVEFGDVTAAMASMTAQGTPTSVATTQLRQMMVELSKDGGDMANTFKEISGKSFKEFIAEGGNTQEALALLSEHAKDSGVGINDLFGSVEAGSAALSLSGDNAKGYADNIDAMGDSAGATEAAYDKMDGGIARTMERIGIQFKDAAIELGENLAPTAQRFADFLQDNLPAAIETATTWMENIFDAISNVYTVLKDQAIPALRDMGDYVRDTLIPAIQDLSAWFQDNQGTIETWATVIGVILIPLMVRIVAHYVAMGIAAVVSGAQTAAVWLLYRLEAIKTGAIYVLQSYKVIGTWVAMAAAAVISGAQTVAIWALYKIEAIKGAAVYLVQRAVIIGSWVAMAAAAVASGLRTAAVWTGMVIKNAIVGAASFAVSAARVVGGWVLMGVQAMLQAARMAAAWFIALGPIGWVTAAVIAIAALVIANWDRIKRWTISIWTSVTNWVVGAWRSIRDRTVAILTAVVSWVTGKFVAMRDRTREIWGSFKDAIVGAWRSVRNFISDFWQNKIKPILSAFGNFIKDTVVGRVEKGVSLLKSGWQKVANIFRKPINWVIGSVWNGGIAKAFNTVSEKVGLKARMADIPKIKAFAKGGRAAPGWAMVGEEGPELVNFSSPGRVYTADQTRNALHGDVEPGRSVHPMGGWGSKIWDAVKGAASGAVSWVRGGLANAAESLFKPIISKATGKMAEFGGMGELGGGLIDTGVDKVLDWIRGEDKAPASGGGYEYDGPMSSGGVHRPGRGPITSWYGQRGGRLHGGIDFAGPRGAPTFAAGDGIVHSIMNYAGSGLSVNLSHGGGKYSHYGHNDPGGIVVKAGQAVKAGQRIGNMGMTGRTTGPHVHFETWQGGLWNRRNPNALFRDNGGLIYPGMNQVLNNTGRPEYTFNERDFNEVRDIVRGGAAGARGGDTYEFHAHNNGSPYQDASDFLMHQRRAQRKAGV